ncbi:hypothetical protein V497_01701 [Pseudogymnoascus sp. VKM F-4516 (FW-969)]|nr:hypothetical protein V497_01701 [Pseudogymnoascus sp. VKM F-4516 (FW-969)]
MGGEEKKDVQGHGSLPLEDEKVLRTDHEPTAEGTTTVISSTTSNDDKSTHDADDAPTGLHILPTKTLSRISQTRSGDRLSFHDPEKGVISTAVLPSPSHSTHALTLREDENYYPEGGLRAWLVVFGSLCSLLAALGVMNTLGSFQAYISRNQLEGVSEGEIGWIFSVYACLAFGLGAVVGPIFDKHGARWLMLVGSVGVVASLMLMSVCEKYWHFMLVFGILGGASTSLIFSPSLAAIGHWFKARRGFATGIGATGGALGGIVYPLMLQYLIPQIGWAWSMRTLGFFSMLLLSIGCVLVRGRLPAERGSSAKPDLTIFRDGVFALTVLAVYLLEWALFVPLTYISSYALSAGFSQDFSYQCLIILNIGSVFGRWLPGFYADKIGAFNTMIVTTILSVVMVLGVWLPAGTTMPGLIIFCLFFGFASGSNIGLTSVCIGKLCRTENLGKYFATAYTFVSLGCLTGIPIAGEILKANGGEYWGLMVFTGVCYGGGLAAFVVVRIIKVGWDVKAVY